MKERLAACCNIIPGLISVYEWEETVCEDPELLLMIKTTQQRLAELTLAVQQLHTYEECEVIAVRIYAFASVLAWERVLFNAASCRFDLRALGHHMAVSPIDR